VYHGATVYPNQVFFCHDNLQPACEFVSLCKYSSIASWCPLQVFRASGISVFTQQVRQVEFRRERQADWLSHWRLTWYSFFVLYTGCSNKMSEVTNAYISNFTEGGPCSFNNPSYYCLKLYSTHVCVPKHTKSIEFCVCAICRFIIPLYMHVQCAHWPWYTDFSSIYRKSLKSGWG